jgi:integrase
LADKGDICYPLLILQRILKVYSPNINDLPVNNCKTLHIDTRILTKEEIRKALNTARKQYKSFYPLLITALLTGMTKGEILVLQWDNINFVDRKIFVNSSLNKGKIKKHTVKKSIREIDIPEILVNVLEKWQQKCPKGKNNLVFPNGDGEIQDSKYISNLQLTPLMNQSGIENVNFIDLRDTYASLLIEQNYPLTYIQKQLGHNSVQITADRYKTLIDEQNPKTIDFDKEIFSL